MSELAWGKTAYDLAKIGLYGASVFGPGWVGAAGRIGGAVLRDKHIKDTYAKYVGDPQMWKRKGHYKKKRKQGNMGRWKKVKGVWRRQVWDPTVARYLNWKRRRDEAPSEDARLHQLAVDYLMDLDQ